MPRPTKKLAPNPLTARRADAPLSFVGTQTVFCGDNLDQLPKIPDECVDLIYIDPPFNSNRNYEVFWGETRETRAFEDRHASTQAYIAFMQPRCLDFPTNGGHPVKRVQSPWEVHHGEKAAYLHPRVQG